MCLSRNPSSFPLRDKTLSPLGCHVLARNGVSASRRRSTLRYSSVPLQALSIATLCTVDYCHFAFCCHLSTLFLNRSGISLLLQSLDRPKAEELTKLGQALSTSLRTCLDNISFLGLVRSFCHSCCQRWQLFLTTIFTNISPGLGKTTTIITRSNKPPCSHLDLFYLTVAKLQPWIFRSERMSESPEGRGKYCITTLDDCYEYHDCATAFISTFFIAYMAGLIHLLRNLALREWTSSISFTYMPQHERNV